MKALKFRPKARADLDDIWSHSTQHWGSAQAERYLRGLQAACTRLCDGTAVAQSADHVLKGCRKIAVGSHVVYFKDGEDEIVVIRILHHRMDVTRHF